ncbi:GNAT family N-acetyltransferase [Candidatus Woesebacteria bacterium]|nr:GNAT family N-acetyltransferase [Candidatus Woesebacteria bacterium]
MQDNTYKESSNTYTFQATIKKIGVNPYVSVPQHILDSIFIEHKKNTGPIPICGFINSLPYKQTLVKFQGEWRLYINTKMLKNSPQRIGEQINLSVTYDTTPRIIAMHPMLEDALIANSEAKKIFNSLSPSHQKEIVRYIANLKSEEKVNLNVQKAIGYLLGKNRFVGRPSIQSDKYASTIIQGEKIKLRPMIPSEFNLFYSWATKSDNSHFWYGELYGTKIPSISEFKKDWKEYYFDGSQPEKGRCFMILVDDKPIGQVNYNDIDRKTNSVELDIIIGERHHTGQGYGSDALQNLVEYLFTRMNIDSCFIEALTQNPRAISAYKKAGFVEQKRYTNNGKEYMYLEKKK